MSGSNLSWKIQLLNDEALVELVTFGEGDGYVPAAIQVARKELTARDVSPWVIAAIAQRLEAERIKAAERASWPLSWTTRIAFLFSSIIIIPAVLACFLESQGYQRKSLDAWRWIGLGVACWISVFAINGLFLLFTS